jgi:hypothetical protein
VREAYEVLKDADSRVLYDTGGLEAVEKLRAVRQRNDSGGGRRQMGGTCVTIYVSTLVYMCDLFTYAVFKELVALSVDIYNTRHTEVMSVSGMVGLSKYYFPCISHSLRLLPSRLFPN